jgi:hypothetical protein
VVGHRVCVPPTLTAPPAQLIAGDTLVVAVPEPTDYPSADGWVHTLSLQAIDGTDATATGVPADGVLTFTVSALNTDALTPGPATWARTATKTTERVTLAYGQMTVLPDPSGDQSTSELAHVQRTIAACEARLENKATEDVLMFQLPDGVMLQKLSIAQVSALLVQYRAKKRRLLSGGRGAVQVREAWYVRRH